jgi:hypothetical protein
MIASNIEKMVNKNVVPNVFFNIIEVPKLFFFFFCNVIFLSMLPSIIGTKSLLTKN